MARRLRDALKLEAVFTEAGLDYLVETGMYLGGFLFKRELAGAFFYVEPTVLERARELVAANGLQVYRDAHAN